MNQCRNGWKALRFQTRYKPYDDSVAESVVTALKEQGIEGLPTDEDQIKTTYGLGWWNYDTDEAESLLLAEGFSRDSNGMWLLPDGTPWKLTYMAPSAYQEVEKFAYAVVEYWKDFGIDAVVQSSDIAYIYYKCFSRLL